MRTKKLNVNQSYPIKSKYSSESDLLDFLEELSFLKQLLLTRLLGIERFLISLNLALNLCKNSYPQSLVYWILH